MRPTVFSSWLGRRIFSCSRSPTDSKIRPQTDSWRRRRRGGFYTFGESFELYIPYHYVLNATCILVFFTPNKTAQKIDSKPQNRKKMMHILLPDKISNATLRNISTHFIFLPQQNPSIKVASPQTLLAISLERNKPIRPLEIIGIFQQDLSCLWSTWKLSITVFHVCCCNLDLR